MFKKIMAALSAFILAGCLYADAEDLVIDGLGKLSFGEDVQITDGGGSRAETIFKKSGHRKDYGKTDWAAVMYFLTTPPGMDMYPDRAPYPYDSLHLYQIRKSDIRGTYSASVSVVKGTEEAFFHGKREKAARFWERAFHEDATRPHSLFGLPKISIEEYQRMLNGRLDEIKGQKLQAELVSFSPWHAYKNHDGTYRWTQEARVIISDERHLSYPMWVYTICTGRAACIISLSYREAIQRRKKSGKIYFMPFTDWKGAAHELEETAAVFMTVLCISGGASAYDLQSIAKAHLPPAFTYQDIPEQQELKFHDFTYPYHMGQLSVMLQKSRKFAYGYIVTAKLPPAGADTLKPFFREYLTVKEWRSLSRMNRAFLDEDSPLRKGAEEVMKNWAKNVVGELGEGVKITLSDFEPYRKLTADEAYLYTMGAKITFDSDGLILPFYGRAYFFRENDHIDVMMLLTPDEGKEPLVYAIDDLAKAAAKETDMQEEKEDLSVMLAKGAAGN